jgi:hypothetical protein
VLSAVFGAGAISAVAWGQAAPEAPTKPLPAGFERLMTGRHAPAGLTRPVRPVRLADGYYACKTDDLYKLRACRIDRDAAGRTWLEMLPNNLLPMRGLLEEDNGTLVFEGFPTEPQPFGCYTCAEACETPGDAACDCNETQLLGRRSCLEQPLVVRFRGAPGAYKGSLTHDTYFQTFTFDGPRAPKAFHVSVNRYNVTLGRKLPGPPSGPRDAL